MRQMTLSRLMQMMTWMRTRRYVIALAVLVGTLLHLYIRRDPPALHQACLASQEVMGLISCEAHLC